jgi:hypothetical protein
MHEDSVRDDYMVVMPHDEPFELFRLVSRAEEAREQDFKSRAARGSKRIWPDEDAADYHAISCYDDLTVARANAAAGNWKGIAAFLVDGHRGFVYAQTYEPHHYSVWGDAEALHDQVQGVEPVGED